MLSRIPLSFILIPAAIAVVGISPPAWADDVSAPVDTVSPLEDTNRKSKSTISGAVWQLFYETDYEGTHVGGLSFMTVDSTTYAGLTAQQIRSPKITYEGEQDNLESVYFFVGVQMDQFLTPFAEAGVDLGELLVEWLLADSENTQETDQDNSSFIDYYLAIGIQGQLKQHLFMRAYFKMYFIQQENGSTFVPVTGFQLGVRF